MIRSRQRQLDGFTVVELLIVIVVIGILAAITIVAFNGVQRRAAVSVLQSDARNIVAQLENHQSVNGSYPTDLTSLSGGAQLSDDTTIEYTFNNPGYCFTVTMQAAQTSYFVSSASRVPGEGVCPGHTGYAAPVAQGPWTKVALGPNHGCGIAGGKAYCWGDNTYGKLGTNNTVASTSPVPVFEEAGFLLGKTVTDIAVADFHTCAIADGLGYCWGRNFYGYLGTGNTTSSNKPVAVSTSGVLSGLTLTEIAVSSEHVCALANNGRAYCWGRNDAGQLGTGATSTQSTVPVAVSTSGALGTQTVTDINAYCAIAGGNPYCWSTNANGQIGNGSTSTVAAGPTATVVGATLPSGVTTQVSNTGLLNQCVLANTRPYCWGSNLYGRVGTGNTTNNNNTTPVAVVQGAMPSLTGYTIIASSFNNTCVSNGVGVYCWGLGNAGQLGNNSTNTSNGSPVAVIDTAFTGKTVTALASGNGDSTCLIAGGDLYCFGRNSSGQLGIGSVVTPILTPTQVTNPSL